MSARILQGDCRELLKTLPDNSVDSIVTDPPYHLSTNKKGGCGQATVNLAHPAGRARVGTGFMGMKWDGGDIAFDPALWAEAMRVLKPGGYLLAFSGTRTYHRMVCAIEDGGFEIRDQLAWVYGSGFPKGTDEAKIPAEWQGFNTALKPAWEPICMARKPMTGTLWDNLTEHGAGALNIDGCRVPTDESIVTFDRVEGDRSREQYRTGTGVNRREVETVGRWPANIIHDGSDEVLAAFPEAAGAQAPDGGGSASRFFKACPWDDEAIGLNRFFYCAKASRTDRNGGLPVGDVPAVSYGATMRDREDADWPGRNGNFHPTVKPTDLCRYLLRLVTPPGGRSLDLFAGSGSFGKAAVLEGFNWTGFELDRDAHDKPVGYIAIAEARIAFARRQAEDAERAAAEETAAKTMDLFTEVAA